MLTELYPYQKVGVRTVQRFGGRALLADEMGLGKTLQALTWADRYRPDDVPGPTVVICPATIKTNWKREARRHLGMRVEVVHGRTPPPGWVPRPDHVYVLNYDILGAVQSPHARNRADSWGNVLSDAAPWLVMGDECQYIKNRQSQRSRAVGRFCRDVQHIIMMSGTPLTNRPAELWPVLNILRPDLFPAFMPYAMRYCAPRRMPWGWDTRGASNLSELHDLLRACCMVRRLKRDVLKDLPAKTRSVVPLELSSAERKEYLEAETDYIRWVEKTSVTAAARQAKAEEMNRLNGLKRLAGRMKVQNVIRWVEDYLDGSESKLLLYGIHRAVLKPIEQRFGRRCVLVDGDTPENERYQRIDRFNKDPRCRLFIGNIHAAGTGWSCTSAHAVAFAELDWVPAMHTQAEDRVHGIGRGVAGVPSHCYYLVAETTVDEDLCRVVQSKQNVVDAALDGEPTGGLDVYTLVRRDILNRRTRRPNPTGAGRR